MREKTDREFSATCAGGTVASCDPHRHPHHPPPSCFIFAPFHDDSVQSIKSKRITPVVIQPIKNPTFLHTQAQFSSVEPTWRRQRQPWGHSGKHAPARESIGAPAHAPPASLSLSLPHCGGTLVISGSRATVRASMAPTRGAHSHTHTHAYKICSTHTQSQTPQSMRGLN